MLTCFSLKAHLKILLNMCTVKRQPLTKQYLYHSTYGKDRKFNKLFPPAGL